MNSRFERENKKKMLRSSGITAKILGIIYFCAGLIILFVNCLTVNQNDRLIAKADSIVGVCTDSKVADNRIAVSYSYNGKDYEDIIINSYGQDFREGDEIELFVLPNIPSWCVIECKVTEGKIRNNILFGITVLMMGVFEYLMGWARLVELEKL